MVDGWLASGGAWWLKHPVAQVLACLPFDWVTILSSEWSMVMLPPSMPAATACDFCQDLLIISYFLLRTYWFQISTTHDLAAAARLLASAIAQYRLPDVVTGSALCHSGSL